MELTQEVLQPSGHDWNNGISIVDHLLEYLMVIIKLSVVFILRILLPIIKDYLDV